MWYHIRMKKVQRETDKNSSDYPTPAIHELFDAILTLKNSNEAIQFFRDLLTVAELTEFANRWQMVKLLIQGKSYTYIAKTLKVSTTTVTRVAYWLRNGMGGYKTVSSRIFDK